MSLITSKPVMLASGKHLTVYPSFEHGIVVVAWYAVYRSIMYCSAQYNNSKLSKLLGLVPELLGHEFHNFVERNDNSRVLSQHPRST